MHFQPEVLAPARRPDELFDDYARRREIGNRALKHYLKGQMFHVSRQPQNISLAGKDEQIDELVRRGEIEVFDTILKNGKEVARLAMAKGITYNKPKPKEEITK